MRPTTPRLRAQGVLLVAALLATPPLGIRPAAAAGSAPPVAELRARTATALAELHTALVDVGRPFDRVSADLVAIAGELERAGLDSLASDAHHGAARALLRMSRVDEAEAQFTLSMAAALRAREPARELRARTGVLVGRVQKHPAETRDGIRELMPRLTALGRDDLLADAHLGLARAADLLGNFEASLAEARQTVAFAVRAGDQDLTLRGLSMCGTELRLLHRNAESLVYTDSVIAVAKRAGLDAALARSLFDRASVLRMQEQYDDALATIDQAIAIHRRRGDRLPEITAVMLRASVLFRMRRFNESAAETRALLASPRVRDVPVTWARIEELHGRALIAAGRPADAETLFAHVMPELERFRGALPGEQERASLGSHVYNNYATWTRARVALGRARDAWETSERGHAIALEGRLGIQGTPDIVELQTRLRASGAAFIAWDVPDPVMGNVIVVTPDTIAAFQLRGEGVREDDLSSFMDRASAEHAMAPSPEAAARVSDALLQDAIPVLRNQVRHLFIVPPALLETVPFEALPLPNEHGQTLGDRFGISYVPSAAVLSWMRSRPAPAAGITVFADPEVDPSSAPIAALDAERRGAVGSALPGARDEAQRMRSLGASVHVGRDANAEQVRRAHASAVMHFATHALDGRGDEARGGIVLAGHDALLTPAVIESLHVTADLVTLAACGTLGSHADLGEGPRGLARAFLVSGARSVVTTRWEVSDRAAARFMREFYARLRAGEPRDRALGQARDRMLAEGLAPRDCWAFSLTGVGDEPVAALAPRGKSGTFPK